MIEPRGASVGAQRARKGATRLQSALVVTTFLLVLASGCYWLYCIISSARY